MAISFKYTISKVGRYTISTVSHAGSMGFIAAKTVQLLVRGKVSARAVVHQMYTMGVQSIPLVLLTALLTGIVTTKQSGYQFTGGSVPLYILGNVVSVSIILELGPVLTSIVMVGRVGARITAELGTMKVSEQVDALISLGRDPIAELAAPRIISGFIIMPLLVAMANSAGILSGMVSAQAFVGLGMESFLFGARLFWYNWDLFYSIGKALAFGLTIPIIAVHMGLKTEGGAEGVGNSTTSAVVMMIIAILVVDALFPALFLD